MSGFTAAAELDTQQRWSTWHMVALERLPLPYAWTVALLGIVVLAEQVLEYFLDHRTFSQVTATALRPALVFVLLFVYILAYLGILKGEAVKELAELRPVVQVDDQVYERHVHHILNADKRVELVLLLLSASVVLLLFVLPPSQLLDSARGLRAAPLLVGFVSGSYVLYGWLLLALVYTSIRYARALGSLASCPLDVNVFDPAGLLPFGRLSLLHSLSLAGVLLIPLILIGPPTRGGYLVIPLSLASLLVLVLPLWGVHRQMVKAKQSVLASIHRQLMEVQAALLRQMDLETQELSMLAGRTGALVNLRKMIQEAPNWPFKSVAAITRAMLAAASPLIYFSLQQLLLAYLVPLFR